MTMDLLAQWTQVQDARARRLSIEKHLNNMEKLFCDDSDCESTSHSGKSMADDIDETIEDFHVGAKVKVAQLWQGQLGSLSVDTTVMIEKKAEVSTTTASNDSMEILNATEENSQGSKPSSICTMKTSSSAENLSSSLHRRCGIRRRPPTRNASFGKVGITRRGGELSQSAHGPRRNHKSLPKSEPNINETRSRSENELPQSTDGAATSEALSNGSSHRRYRKQDALSKSDHKTNLLACRRNGLAKTMSMCEFDATSDSSSNGTGKGDNMSSVASSHRRYRKPDALSTRSEHKRSSKIDVSSDSSSKNSKCDEKPTQLCKIKNDIELGHSARCSRRLGGDLSGSEPGPRRVKSSTSEISQMARSSRKEVVSASLEVATDSSTPPNAPWVEKKSSLTTRPRGVDRSISDHGTRGTRGLLRRGSSARKVLVASRSCGADTMGQMSRSISHICVPSTQEENDSTSGQRSAKPLRRSGSMGTEIELMSKLARKVTPPSTEIASGSHDPTVSNNTTKNAQCGVSPSEGTTVDAPAPVLIALEYNDIKQKYQQSWDSASCFAVVNKIRTEHALNSLERDKDMDTEAQQHAEAIAQSNGNYSAKIDYVAHVLRGTAVIEMHHAAMIQQQQKLGSKSKSQANILNPDFQVMGVGVAKGANNGLLYVCELFHGKFTLCCTADDW
jgi:uncharacterized protein YkwD